MKIILWEYTSNELFRKDVFNFRIFNELVILLLDLKGSMKLRYFFYTTVYSGKFIYENKHFTGTGINFYG